MVQQIATLWRSALDTVDLRDALLFVDDGAAAALAWADSLEALLARGARNVLRLGDAPPAAAAALCLPGGAPNSPPTRAVVLCSTFLPQAHDALRRSLSSAGGGGLASALVLCAHSAAAHAAYQERAAEWAQSTDAYAHYAHVVAEWMGGGGGGAPSVEVRQLELPPALLPLGGGAFLLPAGARARPLLESDLAALPAATGGGGGGGGEGRSDSPRVGGAADVDWSELPADWRRDLGGAALGLAQLTSALRVRPAIFTLGRTATLVGRQLLANLPAAGANDDECGLLIVDRSLDAVAPSLHGAHPLQPLLCAAADAGDADGAEGGHGGWVAEAEGGCVALLDALLAQRSERQVQSTLLRTLATVGDDEGVADVVVPKMPSAPKLRALLDSLRADGGAALRAAPLLDLVGHVLAALESPDAAAAALASHQKLLQHTASEELGAARRPAAAAALPELISLFRSAGGGGGGAPGVRQLLPLLAMVYSLAGPPPPGTSAAAAAELAELEERLRSTLLQACLRDAACGGFLRGGGGGGAAEELPAAELLARREALDGSLRQLFDRLRALGAARGGLGASEALLLSSAQTAGEVYRPLLKGLFERLLGGDDSAELTHISAAAGMAGMRLLGGMAARLGVKARPKPTDHKLVIVYVVGGVSLKEVSELRQLFAQHPAHRLLVGGTRLASPDSVADELVDGLQI